MMEYCQAVVIFLKKVILHYLQKIGTENRRLNNNKNCKHGSQSANEVIEGNTYVSSADQCVSK